MLPNSDRIIRCAIEILRELLQNDARDLVEAHGPSKDLHAQHSDSARPKAKKRGGILEGKVTNN